MSATFYCDLGSPYVYLAGERLVDLGLTDVEWQPISLGSSRLRARVNVNGSW